MKVKKYIFPVIAIILLTTGITGLSFYKKYVKENEAVAYVNDSPVTSIEYNFYYSMIVNNFYTVYHDYIDELGLDITQDFSQQDCIYDGFDTWKDFFVSYTETSILEQRALYDDAISQGLTFDSQKDDWDNFKKQVENQAIINKTTVSNMLKTMYGEYATEKNIKKIFNQYNTARLYELKISREMEVSDEEIEEAYSSYSNEYDTVTYLEYDFEANIEKDMSDDDREKALNEAEENAKKFYDKVYDEKTFEELCKKEAGNDYVFRHENERLSNVPSSTREWLTNCTEEKQTTYIKDESTNTYRVLYFISRQRDNSPTATIRHILIAANASDGSYMPTDEDYEEAKTKAEEILAEFENGDKTEDSFSELAKINSDDTGSSSNGGLITSIAEGSYEEELNNWIFDENRKPGDTGIEKTSFGYHVTYYVETGEAMWKTAIRTDIKTQKIDEKIEEISSSYQFRNINYTQNSTNSVSTESSLESNIGTESMEESSSISITAQGDIVED